MFKYEKIKNLSKINFRKAIGVNKNTFKEIVILLREEEKNIHKNGGRPSKYSVEDRFLIFLNYYRDNISYDRLALFFEMSKSSIWTIINHIESFIVRKNIGNLFNTSILNSKNNKIVIVDATLVKTQRTTNRKTGYSGKIKHFCHKAQIILNPENNQILSCDTISGDIHDKKLFDKSTKNMDKSMKIIADSGYQGIQKNFKEVIIPKKKSKNNFLSDEEKIENKKKSKKRVVIEHAFGYIKTFSTFHYCFRRSKKYFNLAFIVFCNIYNYQLLI